MYILYTQFQWLQICLISAVIIAIGQYVADVDSFILFTAMHNAIGVEKKKKTFDIANQGFAIAFCMV